jgi:hypothetical protein
MLLQLTEDGGGALFYLLAELAVEHFFNERGVKKSPPENRRLLA